MILGVSGIASAQTLSVSPSPAVVGEPLTLTFTAPAGSSTTDWIGLYNTGDPNTAFQNVIYTGGATSGTYVFYGPTTPGSYEFRYLTNNTFNSVATSNTLTVTPAVGFSLTPAFQSAAVGQQVSVAWTAPAGRPVDDWIGVFAAGETDNHNYDPTQWIYTGGATSGTFNFTMPAGGSYVVRYLLRDRYMHVAESAQIGSTYSVTAAPTSAAPGGQVTATWTAPAGTSTLDWIGLFPVGAASHLWTSYVYTNGTPAGSSVFTMPSTPGQYEFRYYLNDGNFLVATSQTITVQ
jgi:hypothetical protein